MTSFGLIAFVLGVLLALFALPNKLSSVKLPKSLAVKKINECAG